MVAKGRGFRSGVKMRLNKETLLTNFSHVTVKCDTVTFHYQQGRVNTVTGSMSHKAWSLSLFGSTFFDNVIFHKKFYDF